MSRIEVQLFGRFELLVSGDTVTNKLQYNSARALLSYLAVEQGTHTRSTVAGLLWPDSSEAEARNNLRQTLFRLTKLLGKGAFQSTRQTIALTNAATIDVIQLESTIAHHDQTKSPSSLAAVPSIYTAPFLDQSATWESILYQEWVLIVRERLHRRVMVAFELLIAHKIAIKEWSTAQAYANQQLTLDSWREHTHRQLMTIYWQQGKHAAAIAQFEACRVTLMDELGIEPSGESVALLDEIKKDKKIRRQEDTETSPLPVSPSSPLPTPPTLFIGRKQELTQIDRWLSADAAPLLTIVGAGGMGKTRLALETARRHVEKVGHSATSSQPNQLLYMPLAGIEAATPSQLLTLIMQALGLNQSGDPLAQLGTFLHNDPRLMILDNFEHLMSTVTMLEQLIEAAPTCKWLITSRESLRLPAEQLLPLRGLTHPTATAQPHEIVLERFDAVKLFFQRARMVRPNFPLSVVQEPFAAQICALVEGLPLAIELAAGWVAYLSCREIAQEIRSDLDFLATTQRGIAERHRSTRAVFDYSWRLLTQEEQTVFGKLTIFRGGFNRAAVLEVTATKLPTLVSLINKSFVQHLPNGRYQIHELLRQFGEEALEQNAQQAQVTKAAHTHYFVSFFEAQGERLFYAEQKEALEGISAEIDNLRAMLRHVIQQKNAAAMARVAYAMSVFFPTRAWYQEGLDWFTQAVATFTSDSPALHSRLLAYLGFSSFLLAHYADGQKQLEQAQTMAAAVNEQQVVLYTLNRLGLLHLYLGDLQASRANAEAALDLAIALNNWAMTATAHKIMAFVSEAQGEHAAALAHYQQALDRYHAHKHWRGIMQVNQSLGLVYHDLEQYDRAIETYQAAIDIAERLDAPVGRYAPLNNWGSVHWARGEYRLAAQKYGESLALAKKTGDQWSVATTTINLGRVATDSGDFVLAQRHLLTGLSNDCPAKCAAAHASSRA